MNKKQCSEETEKVCLTLYIDYYLAKSLNYHLQKELKVYRDLLPWYFIKTCNIYFKSGVS